MNIEIVKIILVKDRLITCGKNKVKGPEDLASLGHDLIGSSDGEVFLLVCLAADHSVNAVHTVSIGTLNSTIVHPREVFKAAILYNSSAVAVIHNHPSGSVKQSNEDMVTTEMLTKAGELIGIPLVDHLVIGEGMYRSLVTGQTGKIKPW